MHQEENNTNFFAPEETQHLILSIQSTTNHYNNTEAFQVGHGISKE